MGYIIFVVATMLVLPVISFIIQKSPAVDNIALLGKWFIFWAIGIRLLVAGFLQTFKPNITASILQVDESSYVLIRELGFANLIFGLLGVFSLFNGSLRLAATAGGFYMGLAGLYHIIRHEQKTDIKETVAMISDLWILVVVIVFCYYTLKNC